MCLTDACLLWIPETNRIRTKIYCTKEIWGWDASDQECTMPYMKIDPAPDISVFPSFLLTLFFFPLPQRFWILSFPVNDVHKPTWPLCSGSSTKLNSQGQKAEGRRDDCSQLLPLLCPWSPPSSLNPDCYLRHSSQHVLKEWFFKSVSCHCETD